MPEGIRAPSGPKLHARLTADPLSLDALAALVKSPHAGALVTFQGTTRSVARLEYESYTEMAAERIATIVAEVADRYRLEGAAAEHRVGSVPLGESSVIVAASAAHRGEAFAGARELIDRIKAEAPIWKREIRAELGATGGQGIRGEPLSPEGQSHWVAGEPPGANPLAAAELSD